METGKTLNKHLLAHDMFYHRLVVTVASVNWFIFLMEHLHVNGVCENVNLRQHMSSNSINYSTHNIQYATQIPRHNWTRQIGEQENKN